MFLLDTDVVIWALRNNQKIISFLLEISESGSLGLSTLTIAEIYKNIFPTEIFQTEEFIRRHIIYGVDEDVAKQGGLYWQEYSKQFKTLNIIDCMIASTAYINDLTLVTLNVKHYPMQGLRLLSS
ncbi:VapC toxin family PIN domain ribonuclease [candidate division WWE3 bacterium CG08_land_8_20_14_0_20_41_10]|uniref:VapC toxin family PIN domain ribonuclease n=1 Tax=candidate division WWE3 bacterium CG08_land_8_20_14_0_20_41_10 TaxID=1975085 RepID=A0A2H0XAU3_UNCKA|nr:MAG: VapC toxin family PIN domain ribonuclease [candidate division WWE3 bacterium CG08_land_8_20_14_0_20_41_10]